MAFALWGEGWLRHLYVAPEWRGHGHGSALVDLAVSESPDGLRLWAFARNVDAIAFYTRHGFEILTRTDGAGNEEREPDVLMSLTGRAATL